jgi:hypothetical protein
MTSLVYLFSKDGRLLAELDTGAVRAWTLNEHNQAQFALSTRDIRCREDYLQFGNYILITHDKLPDWAGMIDTPRSWDANSVEVTAYSAEFILKTRKGAGEATYTGSPGEIFTTLIATANNKFPTLINMGQIYTDGISASRKLSFSTIYDGAAQLSKDTGEDWDISPNIDSRGMLTFQANWYQRKGVLRGLVLEDGENLDIGSRSLVEQGDIYNVVEGVSDGASSSSRMTIELQDDDSMNTYGVRETSQAFQEIRDITSLTVNTQSFLNSAKIPRKTFTMAALDVGTTFFDIRVGDILPLNMSYVGFTREINEFGIKTYVRVLGMAYSDLEGKLNLVCDEMIQVV